MTRPAPCRSLPFSRCVALLGSMFALACGHDQITPLPTLPTTTADTGNPCPRVCAPGSTELCYCPDTHQTAQVCAADGLSWDPCPCGGAMTDAAKPQ
ncbi:MAG TPA: hypothetical protein VHU80_19060 [Polyangiaceae bacterium]|nr:hypothetical protein [Polyangiaceae bacterium]